MAKQIRFPRLGKTRDESEEGDRERRKQLMADAEARLDALRNQIRLIEIKRGKNQPGSG